MKVMTKISDPFDYEKFIGTVARVTPQITRIHFPSSKLLKKFYYDGDSLHGGVVRNYVVIEGEGVGFLAKIVSISLPEKERLELTEDSFKNSDLHPVGEVEIDLVFDVFDEFKAQKGVNQYPPVGAKVFACSPSFLQHFLQNFGKKEESNSEDLLDVALLPHDTDYKFSLSANAVFNRHCAIIGTTGGGKSWTVAKLIESMIAKERAKVILLDATGEFRKFGSRPKTKSRIVGEDSFLHFSNLEDEDFFALFRPAGQVQLPKLQEAVKSLRIVEVKGGNPCPDESRDTFTESITPEVPDSPAIENGILKKAYKQKSGYFKFCIEKQAEINSSNTPFVMKNLPMQILHECVGEWEDGKWDKPYQRDKDNCASLVLRINSLIHNEEANSIFNFQDNLPSDFNSLSEDIEGFVNSDSDLLLLNLERIPKDTDISNIFTNAVGRKLLKIAKSGKFKEAPVIVFIDEAHLFLNRKVKDEYSIEVELNAFERIAKECRKYGLFICISTQRPRDIPEGVLSQMGTFIAHRLINRFDREAIERAAPEGSRYALSFLPSLGEGEALLMGVNFPMPINLKIDLVSKEFEPDSKTPVLFKKK